MENEHLLMSVYPYEVSLSHLNANNDNSFGGASIIYQKEILKKIPRDGLCKEQTMTQFLQCIKAKLKVALEKAQPKCKVAALNFTEYNSDHLQFCQTKDEALKIEGLIYQLAQDTHNQNLCGSLCSRTIYKSRMNFYSKRVLGKELKTYGNGYYIVWAFYSSLYVSEKVETYIFDFDSALVAVGGSLGLFLGMK